MCELDLYKLVNDYAHLKLYLLTLTHIPLFLKVLIETYTVA
jgi:hypothetical protein